MKKDANGETVRDANGNPVYETQYHITDHLGSVRVVINQAGEVLARNDYYPFGKSHNNPSLMTGLTNPATPEANRFLFNGKEKQLTGGLNLLDYGWRMHDPEIGRWNGVDPLCERRYFSNPYGYCLNNPIMYVDIDGLTDWSAFWRGLGTTTLGVVTVAGGAVVAGGTGGLAAPLGGTLVMSGMAEVAFGVTQLVGAFTSDGSDASKEQLESLPTSMPDLVGIVVDETTESNGEGRLTASGVSFGVSALQGDTFGTFINGISLMSNYSDYLDNKEKEATTSSETTTPNDSSSNSSQDTSNNQSSSEATKPSRKQTSEDPDKEHLYSPGWM